MELARRWDQDAIPPECEDGSEEGQRQALIAKGQREAKRECADTLRTLVSLLGDKENNRHDKTIDR